MTDLFYSALNRALDEAAPRIVRVKCEFCTDGHVVVPDGSAFPGTVICHYCNGRGSYLTEKPA